MTIATLNDLKNHRERCVYDAIAKAAAAGARCPTNEELGALVGVAAGGTATISGVIGKLERDGKIAVERFATQRRVTIAASGDVTLVTGNLKPHWRYVGVSQEAHHVADREKRERLRHESCARMASGPKPAPTAVPSPPVNPPVKPLHPLVEAANSFAARHREVRKLSGTSLNPVDHRKRTRIFSAASVESDPRPIALTRNPCPRCATRGDLGCAHQQPYQEAAAQ